jgi:hypothetical protein
MQPLAVVIFAVLNIRTTFKQQYLETALAEFLGGPTA